MKVLYKNADREAVWDDAFLDGDEIIMDGLRHTTRYPQLQSLTVTGPHLVPDLWTFEGAIAAGMQAGFEMEHEQPESAKVPEGATDGRNVIEKHLPGEHDQSTHGRKKAVSSDYRGQHQPSGTYGSPLHDMGQIMGGNDIYDHPEWYFSMREPHNKLAARIMQRARGKPDMPVKIYRAVPTGTTDKIEFGDWVTTVPSAAKLHGEGSLGGRTDAQGEWTPNPFIILTDTVPAKDLMWPGDSLVEYGWFPGNEGNIEKHRPGGVDHDQGLHGSWSDGSNEDPKGLGLPSVNVPGLTDAPTSSVHRVEQVSDLSTWLKDQTGMTKTQVDNLHRGLLYDQTPASYEAMRLYGTVGDQVFTWYRGGDIPAYNDLTDQEVSGLIEELVVATEAPLYTDMTLFRGFGSSDMGFKLGDDPASLIGTEISTGGSFTSTSISPSAATAFATLGLGEGELSVIMKMWAPKGTSGTYLEGETPYVGEYEVLLPPGKSMTITEVTVLEKVGNLDKPVLVLDARIN